MNTKIAFLNEAKLFIERETDNIKVSLAAELPSGTQKIGRTEAVKLAGTKNYINEKEVWQQHRSIESPAYQGLGYATDMLIALLREVHNNGGVTVSFSRPSAAARAHNISLIGKPGMKVSKVAIIEGKNMRALTPPDPSFVFSLLQSGEIPPSNHEENDDFLENLFQKITSPFQRDLQSRLESLFSSPYGDIEIPGYLIHSALMLEWEGAKPSLPTIDSWQPTYKETEIHETFSPKEETPPELRSSMNERYEAELANLQEERRKREEEVSRIRNPSPFSKFKKHLKNLKILSASLRNLNLKSESEEISKLLK